MKLKLGFHILIVQDVNRALCFYRDVLRLDVQAIDSNNDSPEWARLALGDTIIILRRNSAGANDDTMAAAPIYFVREGGVDGMNWSGLYFEASDIPDMCLRVEEGGGRTLNPPRRARYGAIVADVVDTEGNVFILYSDY